MREKPLRGQRSHNGGSRGVAPIEPEVEVEGDRKSLASEPIASRGIRGDIQFCL